MLASSSIFLQFNRLSLSLPFITFFFLLPASLFLLTVSSFPCFSLSLIFYNMRLASSFSHKLTSSSIAPTSLTKPNRRDQFLVSQILHSTAHIPRKISRFYSSHPMVDPHSTSDTIKRSCSAKLDEIFDQELPERNINSLDLSEDENIEDGINTKTNCHVSKTNLSFLQSKFDLLEPVMLGIRPESPEWAQRELKWASIERKANRVELPISIRMIKKKQQWKKGFRDLGESTICSMEKAFSSMMSIILEIQRCTLEMRGLFSYEDTERIIAKAQREMHLSLVWLFKQVFSQTPALMIHVMILLANFSAYSTTHIGMMDPSFLGSVCESITEEPCQQFLQSNSSPIEMNLDASKNHGQYYRTDLLYRMRLSHDPNNPLLLCNYAQFLHLFAHEFDRAEECFKQAIETELPDAEALSKYANFLWVIRKDLWGAEERYLQAVAVEPDNTYHASIYADFLWSTGGEETCFPLKYSQ